MQRPDTKAIANNILDLLAAVSIPAGLLTTCNQTIFADPVNPQTVTPAAMPAAIQVGATLCIDAGPTQEAVVVTAITSTTFTAIFTQNHVSLPWIIALPVYHTLKLGAMQDPTDIAVYASVSLLHRKTERFAGSGYKVNSLPVLEIETGLDMTNADMSVVEAKLMDIADALTSLFVERFEIAQAQGVYVNLVDQDDEALYKEYPNGRVYRVHLCYVQPIQQYNVTPTA